MDLPNAYDRDSPLMVACSKGHVSTVKVKKESQFSQDTDDVYGCVSFVPFALKTLSGKSMLYWNNNPKSTLKMVDSVHFEVVVFWGHFSQFSNSLVNHFYDTFPGANRSWM